MYDKTRDSDKSSVLPENSQETPGASGQDAIKDVAGAGTQFWRRLGGVIRCSTEAFAEFAADRGATWQVAALLVGAIAIGLVGSDFDEIYSEMSRLGMAARVPALQAAVMPVALISFALWVGVVKLAG